MACMKLQKKVVAWQGEVTPSGSSPWNNILQASHFWKINNSKVLEGIASFPYGN